MAKWAVTRQRYWPDGELVVEVAAGGLDYANADMLAVKWWRLGEGQEFSDPVEAANAAIAVFEAWRKASPDAEINVAYGATGGFSLPFDPCTTDELLAWAEKRHEELPKCDRCGELLGRETFAYVDLPGEMFCREYCAEEAYADAFADADFEDDADNVIRDDEG